MSEQDFSAIPAALRDRRQWLIWKLEAKPGAKKPAKMPYYASGKRRTGVQGSDKDRAALVPLDAAVAAMARHGAAGIGFAFLPGDGLIGIDLDHAVDADTGELSPRAQAIIAACGSYTEWSPSGSGFHIYVLGTTDTAKDNGIGVEMFCGRQYFTVTGRHFSGTPLEVASIDDKTLRRLHKTIAAAKGGFSDAPAPVPPVAKRSAGVASERDRVVDALNAIDPDIGYDDWYQIGMALQAVLGPDGLGVWESWSARSARFPGAHVLAAHWRSFKSGRVGPGTLFYHAKRAGWKSPRGWKPKPFLPPAEAPAMEGQAPGEAMPRGGSPFWRTGLWRSDSGAPRPVRDNVVHLLREHPALAGLVGYNVFANRCELLRSPPWGGEPGEWKRRDTAELAAWMATEIALLLQLRDVEDAVSLAAWRQQMNPVRDAFNALAPWDGVERLPFWLIECMGALDTPYHRLVGTKFLMGLVKRVMHPGCKFDYMLIFEGAQGIGKSSAGRILAMRDEWFSDTPFHANLDRDARMALHGCLVHEVSEMQGFNQADIRAVKIFLSQMEDRVRVPYAQQFETFRRSMVFVGTTNETEYFRDPTGNRRFLPVACRAVDLERLRQWLPQLYAEALHRVRAGESVAPSREEETTLCVPEQQKRLIQHPWTDFIAEYLGKPEMSGATFVSYPGIFRDCLKFDAARIDHQGNAQAHIRRAMESLGWFRDREYINGVRLRGFKPLTKLENVVEADENELPI
jgi:predicted P-loop ATPase